MEIDVCKWLHDFEDILNETGVWDIVSQCPHYKSQQEASRRFYAVERDGKILFPKMIKMFFKPRQEKIDN